MYRHNPKIEEAPLQRELMLFDPESSQFYLLNSTMAFIWGRCHEDHSLESLMDGMMGEFEGVDLVSAESEVRQAFDDLVRLGLLVDVTALGR